MKLKPEQGTDGRFLPGNNGGAGRPKGSRNKLGEEFLETLATDFEQHGKSVIATVRKTKPEIYLRVVADLLPAQLTVETSRRFVVRLPEPVATTEEWLKKYAPRAKGGLDNVH